MAFIGGATLPVWDAGGCTVSLASTDGRGFRCGMLVVIRSACGCTVSLTGTDGRGRKAAAVWTEEDAAAGLGGADGRWRSGARRDGDIEGMGGPGHRLDDAGTTPARRTYPQRILNCGGGDPARIGGRAGGAPGVEMGSQPPLHTG